MIFNARKIRPNKKVLITIYGLNIYSNEGAKNRLNMFVNSYRDSGYEVTVVVFFSVKGFFGSGRNKNNLNENCKWILMPALPISKYEFLTKLAILYSQVVVAILSRLSLFEIVQSEFLGDAGRWVKKESLYVTDFHGDSFSEADFSYGRNKKWLLSIFRKSQIKSLKYSDHVIVVSHNLALQLEKNTGLKVNSYSVVSCGVDFERFSGGATCLRHDKNDRILLGYIGSLQKWQNIKETLVIFKRLMDLDSRYFLVIYTSDDPHDYQAELELIGDKNFEIRSLNYNEVPNYLQRLDAGFLIREKLVLNIVSSPTKLAEYLASGVPVICTRYAGDFGRCVSHCKEGFILDEMNVDDDLLFRLHQYLLNVKKNREYYREACIESVKDRNWKTEFSAFLKKIKSIY